MSTWSHHHSYCVSQKMRLDRDIASVFTHLTFCFITIDHCHRCPACHRSLAGRVSQRHVTCI